MCLARTPYATHLRGFQGFPAALDVPAQGHGTNGVLNSLTWWPRRDNLIFESNKPSVGEGLLKNHVLMTWTVATQDKKELI